MRSAIDGRQVTASPAPPVRLAVVVPALGIAQIASWGSLYYAFAVLSGPIQAELQIDQPVLFGAFTLALLVSALTAPRCDRPLWRQAHPVRRFPPRRAGTGDAGDGAGAAVLCLCGVERRAFRMAGVGAVSAGKSVAGVADCGDPDQGCRSGAACPDRNQATAAPAGLRRRS